MNRLNEYRIMWVLVFFDLPTETKKEKKHIRISVNK
jgi:CRISPR-associated protein Cas2